MGDKQRVNTLASTNVVMDEMIAQLREIHRLLEGSIYNNRKRGGGRETNRQSHVANKNLKIMAEIPYFSGHMHVDDFLNWLDEVEKFFLIMKVPDHKQVKKVASRLKNTAADWWDDHQRVRTMQGKDPIKTWRKMKGLLKEKFLFRDFSTKKYFSKMEEKKIVLEKFVSTIQNSCLIEEQAKDTLMEEAFEDIAHEFEIEDSDLPVENNYCFIEERAENIPLKEASQEIVCP